MTTCIFRIIDNQLVTVSGADSGTYPIVDNKADILISGVTYTIMPFNNTAPLNCFDNTITIDIE